MVSSLSISRRFRRPWLHSWRCGGGRPAGSEAVHAGDGREMRRHRALLDAVKICLPRHHHEHLLDFSLTCDESARLIFINTLFSSPALHSAMAMATILLFPAACGQSISRARLRNPSGRVGTVPRDPRRRGCGGLGGTDLCVWPMAAAGWRWGRLRRRGR
ncbi:hypothetical protein BRADI_5g25941v3 [Brachypodium distachyon]|uniref:Uncharacterized protein n=1 Tax=Brachypodium distachyon TaxID=15368 RepID=A0A0Q3GW64_BRADI|nr:hypothetical protein BRADI_5g25941v3 [Brachypodium distachyon]